MKKILFIFIFSLVLAIWWTDVRAQTIGISPVSHKLWGETTGMSEFYIEYKFLGFHYFHNWDDTLYRLHGTDKIIQKTSALAISVVPLDLKYFRSGVIVFNWNFPVSVASRVQFLLEGVLPIHRFAISYRHISNGFGLFNKINPGIDSFSIKYHFE